MTLRIKQRQTGAIVTIPNVEYIRRVDEKRNIRTMHFYEIKQSDVPAPVKRGMSEFDILEITQ